MDTITDFSQLDLNGTYSYADYLKWRFQERVELLRGKIFRMTPAPNVKHQRVAGKLYLQMSQAFAGNSCQLFFAPFDVRLYNRKKSLKASKEIFTVVQPDLCLVCDGSKLDEQGCNGAPDLVVEILSPGNTKREMKDKFELYEEAGVREYWLVEPNDEFVLVYVLNEEERYVTHQPATKLARSTVFPELCVDLDELFSYPK
ncbi:MAG: Uma2 family endonuclease [Bacteroidetes bacterium]|mgnify:CR=1 FL=1|nr:Uma2 family endonuclease [Bacteroidota bacterium]